MKNLILAIVLLSITNMNAQAGRSSASLSMSRSNDVFTPEQIVVEEYINYHRHNIKLPINNEKIAISISENRINENTLAVQVGIATKRLIDYSQLAPVNVSLVIDRSGSMSGGPLNKVKKSLLRFVEGLRPNDYISIVVYDDTAEVILSSQKVKDSPNLQGVIESISEGGSTNLCDGMVLGYKEVLKHFNKKGTNKVILLTDGLANTGTIKSEDIIKKSYAFNKEGIDISTIGVGGGVDFNLLRQLSSQGRGDNHFVGDIEEDVAKVFDDELESLLSSIAKDVNLEITFPKDTKINKIYGYTPKYKGNTVKIPLKNINSGLTQVVLSEVQFDKNITSPISAKLTYFDVVSQTRKELKSKKTIEISKQLQQTNEVLKNYYIGTMAMSMKEMAKKVSENKNEEGLRILVNCINNLHKKFPRLRDTDLIRVKNIVVKNIEKLNRSYSSNNGRNTQNKGYLLIPIR